MNKPNWHGFIKFAGNPLPASVLLLFPFDRCLFSLPVALEALFFWSGTCGARGTNQRHEHEHHDHEHHDGGMPRYHG